MAVSGMFTREVKIQLGLRGGFSPLRAPLLRISMEFFLGLLQGESSSLSFLV